MAADGVGEVDVDPAAADAGETGSHTVEFTATGVNETGTLTVAFPEAFGGGGDDGGGSVGAVAADDVAVIGGDLDGEPSVDDGAVRFDVDVDGESEDVEVAVTVELTQPWAAGTHDVTVTAESADGNDASGTNEDALETTVNPTYLVDGEPRSTVFGGQAARVAGLEPGTDYQLRRGDEDDSEPVLTETADDDGAIRFETDELPTGEGYFLDDADDPAAGDGFELVTHELDVSVGDETVADAGDDAETTLSVDSALRTGTYPVNVSAGGALDATELFAVLTGGESADGVPRDADPDDLESATTTVGPSGFAVALYDSSVDGADERVVLVDGGENAGTVAFEDVRRTTYDVEAEALDTGASDAASVTVEEAELDGSFGQEMYSTPAGDLVEISASLGESDAGYVVVGGDYQSDTGAASGYLDVLYVEGDPTITVNTRLIGTDADTDEVYESDGTVVSYAHEYGPDARADDTETFDGLRFEDADGNAVGESLSELRSASGVGGIAGPLIPQRYRLTVGNGNAIVVRDDGVVEPDRAFARSHLLLTEPAFREAVDVYTAPGGSASSEESLGELLADGTAVPGTNVTEGDRLVLGFEATGIWGALAHLADENPEYENGRETVYEDGEGSSTLLADLTAVDEGVSLSVRQTNPGRNERRAELDLASASTGDAYLYFADPDGGLGGDEDGTAGGDGGPADTDLGDGPTAGAVYLVVDTAGGAFTDEPAPGDEFEIEWALEGDEEERFRFDRAGTGPPGPFDAESVDDDRLGQQYPYLSYDEGGVATTATFRIREERLEYDRTTADGDLLVANVEDATIAGNTTLHPATELTAELISDAGPTPTVSSTDVEIDEDGAFAIDADFSAVEPGQRVTFELYDSDGLYDSRSVVVVTDPDEPFSFAIENATETVTVTEGEPIENLTATVRNEGDVRGVGRLSLDVNGRLVDDERVRVWPDATEPVEFADATVDLEPGEYPFTFAVGDAEADGTLAVEPSPDRGEEPADTEADVDDVDDASDVTDDAIDEDVDGGSDEDGESSADEDGDGADEDGDGSDEDEERPAIPLPFGIGPREAFGGTTIVGATYILGHWV